MRIDLVNYHDFDLTKKEYDEAHKELLVILKDKLLAQKYDYCFNKYYPSLTMKQRIQLLCKIYVAHYKETTNKNDLGMEILNFLPIHLFNLHNISSYRCFIFEPNNAATYNSSTYLLKRFMRPKSFESEKEEYLILLITTILRSLSTCFALFELGDDVHAFATMRGFIEQEIKLCILLQKSDTMDNFILFNKYNADLQKGKESKAMRDLFSANYIRSDGEKENFLLYGWASQQRKILSFRSLLEVYDSEHAMKIYNLFSEASEFVHEDYLNKDYDFMAMRKKYADYLTLIFFKFLYPLIENYLGKDILILNGVKIKNLVDTNLIKNELKQSIPITKKFKNMDY